MSTLFRRSPWLTLGVVFLAFLAWGQSRKKIEDESQIKALVETQNRVLVHEDAESLLPQDLRGIYQAASSIKNDPNQTTTVQEALEQIVAARGDPTPLAVTFDDLHGLWGGLRLTIHGTGQVDQKAVREQVGEPRKVSRKELDLLVALLVKQAAWEQRIPERTALPDESRAHLTIEYGTVSTVIWEWYNELEQNHRITEIRDFMKKIAWNHSGSSVAGLRLPPEIHTVTAHGITAHFAEEKPPVEVDAPPEYSVEALWFTFEGDQRFYVFKPKGELFFTDWSFELFSPDGAHVLLPQSHYGPYHVVATDRLKDYLLGRAKPDHVVTKQGGRSDPVMAHSGGHWISAREIQFTVACCGSSETLIYRLGQQTALKASNADRTSGYQLLADGSIHPDRDGPPQGLYVRGTIRSSNNDSVYRFEPAGDVRGTGELGKSGHHGWLELHDGSFHGDEEARVPARPYVRGFRISDGRFLPRSRKITY